MTCNERISSHLSVIEWESNNEIWFKWGQNEKEKNLGHLPCFKNFLTPLSLKSLTIIPGWEKYHSSIISFILRTFTIWMTIEWQSRHFTMTQNDRDEQGMGVIKSSPSKNSIIPTSFRSFHHWYPMISHRNGREVRNWVWNDRNNIPFFSLFSHWMSDKWWNMV